jgi:hemolysin D
MTFLKRAQHALEQRVATGATGGEALQQSKFWMRATTWTLMGTAMFGFAWLALAQTEEIVSAPGKLEPIGSVSEVQIPVNGVVKQVFVKEGSRVERGQVLLQLDTAASAERLSNARKSIGLKLQQSQLKQQELDQYLKINASEQAMLRENLALQESIEKSFKQLERQGASARLQLLQQQNQVAEVRGRLNQTQLDRSRQTAILQQNIQQLRSESAQLRSELADQSLNVRYQTLKAPVSGLVFELKAKSAGFVSASTEPALKIVPFDKLEAKVEVPSSDIGFVRTGQDAEISIDSFPATDFGVLEGQVRQVGSDALPPDQLKPEYRFPAWINLRSQQLSLKNGSTLPLQVGMSLRAQIKLRKTTYLQLLLGTFRDKADSLRRI